jgi:hypothetical protein
MLLLLLVTLLLLLLLVMPTWQRSLSLCTLVTTRKF